MSFDLQANQTVYLDPGQELLDGAEEIAKYLFGETLPLINARNRVYTLIKSRKIPVFHMGNRVYARKSSLNKWIEDQERGNYLGNIS